MVDFREHGHKSLDSIKQELLGQLRHYKLLESRPNLTLLGLAWKKKVSSDKRKSINQYGAVPRYYGI
jgi:hypothetical protein